VVKKNVYLPIEICDVIEGQRYVRKLNERQAADIIKFTCQSPHDHANKIRQGMDLLNYRANDYLKQFGLVVSIDMIAVEARILPIHYLSSFLT
jgi:eukaryotic translation initiation factor 2C